MFKTSTPCILCVVFFPAIVQQTRAFLLFKMNGLHYNRTQHSTHLTCILGSGLQETPEILLLVEHVLRSLVDPLGQGEVSVLEQFLAGVDDDLLGVAGDAGHPRGVLHTHVEHDETQHQAQELVHVLTRHHRHVVAGDKGVTF